MFATSGTRAADVIALTDGYIGTLMYSEPEQLHDVYPELMNRFNVRLAEGTLEEKLQDTGMTLEDLEAGSRKRQTEQLLKLQASANWKARHHEMVELREGLYADLHDELAAAEEAEAIAARGDTRKSGVLSSLLGRRRSVSAAQSDAGSADGGGAGAAGGRRRASDLLKAK